MQSQPLYLPYSMKGMRKRFLPGLGLLLSFILSNLAHAQDTLPGFSVADKGNGRVVVSWKNSFETINQIAVQRSFDSLKKFTTIYSAPSPELRENGFTDQIAPGATMYYRIFFVLQGGTFFFTPSKKPEIGTTVTSGIDSKRDKASEIIKSGDNSKTRDKATDLVKDAVKIPARKIFIKLADSLYATLIDGEYTRFKDSIMYRTKDTLYPLSTDTVMIRQYVQPYVWKSSVYVYTDKEGYVVINLPDASNKKYELRIMEEDNTPVLELKQIRNPYLTLDKANFYHAGWYKFELLEDGKIKDRNKILIPKDF